MKYPWVSGIFVWTGFDYLGEPTPYGWPARSSYFGIIDLAGFPKDVYYLYKSLWTDDLVLHILPHWNWAEGDTVDVIAYTNMKDVELFLNGESLGKQELKQGDLHLMWKVPFKPGELRAVGHSVDDIEISDVVRTAGVPSRLASTADRYSLTADGQDLSFITVDVVDANGVRVPDANNMIKFIVEGPAEIVALDNGDQCCHEKFQGVNQHSAFNGKCLCIVRSIRGNDGRVVVRASADGLEGTEVEIYTK
jgi:beta-galactosidase